MSNLSIFGFPKKKNVPKPTPPKKKHGSSHLPKDLGTLPTSEDRTRDVVKIQSTVRRFLVRNRRFQLLAKVTGISSMDDGEISKTISYHMLVGGDWNRWLIVVYSG